MFSNTATLHKYSQSNTSTSTEINLTRWMCGFMIRLHSRCRILARTQYVSYMFMFVWMYGMYTKCVRAALYTSMWLTKPLKWLSTEHLLFLYSCFFLFPGSGYCRYRFFFYLSSTLFRHLQPSISISFKVF